MNGSPFEKTSSGRFYVVRCMEARQAVEALCGANNADLYLTFIDSYLALLSDSPIDPGKPDFIFRKFGKRLLTEDPKSLITSFSRLADELLRTATVTSEFTITGEFLTGMKNTPIFREYLHFFKTGDSAVLKYILSFLYFGKKMDYEDNDLESAAFRDWLEIEAELGRLTIQPSIVEALRRIIASLNLNLDDTLLMPKHGPGYTAEGHIDPSDKLDNLSLDRKSRYVFRPTSFGRSSVDRISLSEFLTRPDQEQIAKLRFVPKNVKTMRSICMEPISRMFLQQECARWVIDAIEQSALHRIITLRDQTGNQRYAVASSYSQSCDTIDLSAASDRVHVDLVKAVFPRKWLYYLLGTRTSRVDTGKGIVTLKKFAPMGSALCFPIQSILFSAITILAYMMRHYGVTPEDEPSEDWALLDHAAEFISKMHSKPEELLQSFLLPKVYGDDIICDYRVTDYVLCLLARCGLKVNSEKSFIGGSPYRESCGIYAYLGMDVTPYLFRVKRYKRHLDAHSLSSMIDSANRAGDFGYRHLRSCLIYTLKHSSTDGIQDISSYIPFVDNRDFFGIFCACPRPRITRENTSYQRTEQRVLCIRSLSGGRVSPLMESYAYDQWQRARIRGGSDEINFSSSRIRPHATRIRLGWTPV